MSVITSVNITETTKFPAADGDELQVLLFSTFYLLSAFLLAVIIMVKIQMARVRFGELSFLLMKRHTEMLYNTVITEKKRRIVGTQRVYGLRYSITSRRRLRKRYEKKRRTRNNGEVLDDDRKDEGSGNVGDVRLDYPRVDEHDHQGAYNDASKRGDEGRTDALQNYEEDCATEDQLNQDKEETVDLSQRPEVADNEQSRKPGQEEKDNGTVSACLDVFNNIATLKEELESRRFRAAIDKITGKDLRCYGDGEAGDIILRSRVPEDKIIGGEKRPESPDDRRAESEGSAISEPTSKELRSTSDISAEDGRGTTSVGGETRPESPDDRSGSAESEGSAISEPTSKELRSSSHISAEDERGTTSVGGETRPESPDDRSGNAESEGSAMSEPTSKELRSTSQISAEDERGTNSVEKFSILNGGSIGKVSALTTDGTCSQMVTGGDKKVMKQGENGCSDRTWQEDRSSDAAEKLLNSAREAKSTDVRDGERSGAEGDIRNSKRVFEPSMEGYYIVKTRRGYTVKKTKENGRPRWRRFLCCGS